MPNDPAALHARVEQWLNRPSALYLRDTGILIRDLAAEVTRLQAQLHAAEAKIATLEKNLGVCDRMLQDEIEDNRERHPHE